MPDPSTRPPAHPLLPPQDVAFDGPDRRPTHGERLALPLRGLVVLVVEDSRFACDAMRLILHRLGARMRRAGTLAAARAHLAARMPHVVIVDLGLPDGRGEGLIREMAAMPHGPLLLATSADLDAFAGAMDAGAAGFIPKPVARIADLAAAILCHLPDADRRRAAASMPGGALRFDPLAMRDDLAFAAMRLSAGPDDGARRYLSGFVAGLARQAADDALGQAALAAHDGAGLGHLSAMIAERLHRADADAGPV